MSVTFLIGDIIKTGTASIVFSNVSKVAGQKGISDMIKFSGWACIGLDLFLLIQPVIDFCVSAGYTITEITERVSQALSWVGM